MLSVSKPTSVTDWLGLIFIVLGFASTHLVSISDLESTQEDLERRVAKLDEADFPSRVNYLEKMDEQRLKPDDVKAALQDALKPLDDKLTDYIARADETDRRLQDDIRELERRRGSD